MPVAERSNRHEGSERHVVTTRSTSTEHQRPTVYVTAGLVDGLLDVARRNEPDSVTVGIRTTPAGDLDLPLGVPADVPVFTHFYFPETAGSNRSVFGVDLSIPIGRTDGLFVSHPRSDLRLSKRDDLHQVVLVSVPPWERDTTGAFDRAGRRYPLRVLAVVPPEETLPDDRRSGLG